VADKIKINEKQARVFEPQSRKTTDSSWNVCTNFYEFKLQFLVNSHIVCSGARQRLLGMWFVVDTGISWRCFIANREEYLIWSENLIKARCLYSCFWNTRRGKVLIEVYSTMFHHVHHSFRHRVCCCNVIFFIAISYVNCCNQIKISISKRCN
jgi:hypothetical protein